MPRVRDSRVVRSLLCLHQHLANDPAYRHYPLYAALVFGAYWGFARWPWGWANVWVMVEYYELVCVLDAIWPSAFALAVMLAWIGLFRRRMLQRVLALGTLIVASQDQLVPEWLRSWLFWPEGFELAPLVLLWYVFVEPAVQVQEAAGAHRQAGAWVFAVQLLLGYVALRRWVWPRVRRASIGWLERWTVLRRVVWDSSGDQR